MKRRTKKKLAKRGNYFHYYDYCVHKAKYEYLCRKYGMDEVDNFYAENYENEYRRNLTIELTDNHGRIVDIKLFRNCYPTSLPITEKDKYTFYMR